jgi:superoxide dismutase, Cu-Zn family
VSRAAVALASLLAAGCVPFLQAPPTGNTATAELRRADGQSVGTANLTEVSGGVLVVLEMRGMPPGVKAVHVHEVGTCEPPDWASAGQHLNPDKKQHGLLNPAGPHAGDLANITIGSDGAGRMETMNERITLGAGPVSILASGGTALIVHAMPDDFRTDPDGGSGARIACGVITRSETGPERVTPSRAPARPGS